MRAPVGVLLLCAVLACTTLACTAAPRGGGGRAGALPSIATRTAEPADVVADGADAGGLRVLDHLGVGDADTVVVEVGEGDRAWLLGVRASSPGAAEELVGVREVVDPTGQVRYRADLRREVVLVDDLDERVIADAGAVGIYVAEDVDRPLAPGPWEVVVATNGDAVDVGVAITRGEPTAPRHLDLVVWATTEVDPDAVAAAWRAAMDAVLRPHGMRIGRLDVHRAGPAGDAFRTLGVDGLAGEVHRACEVASQATGASLRTVVVVLAERIGEGVLTAGTGPGGAGGVSLAARHPDGDIGGFASSTPGTPVVGPASHACAAVSAGPGVDPADRGLTALHEVLHLAGLPRHTTEEDGRAFDDIADTPECPAEAADVDGDRRVSAGECRRAGADNLMFWAEGGVTLTPGQAWRVRWHPLLVEG